MSGHACLSSGYPGIHSWMFFLKWTEDESTFTSDWAKVTKLMWTKRKDQRAHTHALWEKRRTTLACGGSPQWLPSTGKPLLAPGTTWNPTPGQAGRLNLRPCWQLDSFERKGPVCFPQIASICFIRTVRIKGKRNPAFCPSCSLSKTIVVQECSESYHYSKTEGLATGYVFHRLCLTSFLTIAPREKQYHLLHLTDEETETWEGWATFPRPQS